MRRYSRLEHKDPILWQKAFDLAVAAYGACAALPRTEAFGLASQMRRAASSIPSNIAEGYARKSPREYLYFLRVARGSTAELETHLLLAHSVGYISDESIVTVLQEQSLEVERILRAVIGATARRQQ
jgi:four helix bundle protein